MKRCTRDKFEFIQEHTNNGLICDVAGNEEGTAEVNMDLPVIDGEHTDFTSLRPIPDLSKSDSMAGFFFSWN